MLLRMFNAEVKPSPQVTLTVIVYWDAAEKPPISEPNTRFQPVLTQKPFSRTEMLQAVNDAINRWKNTAMLGSKTFSLETFAEALVQDAELGAIKVTISDNFANGVEAFHHTKWSAFMGGKA